VSPELNPARKAFFCPALVNAARTANEMVPSTKSGPLAAVVSVLRVQQVDAHVPVCVDLIEQPLEISQ